MPKVLEGRASPSSASFVTTVSISSTGIVGSIPLNRIAVRLWVKGIVPAKGTEKTSSVDEICALYILRQSMVWQPCREDKCCRSACSRDFVARRSTNRIQVPSLLSR